jgi:hypothetical protein
VVAESALTDSHEGPQLWLGLKSLLDVQMMRFVGTTDLKVASNITKHCLVSLQCDVKAPLEDLEILISTLSGAKGSPQAAQDVVSMLHCCRQTLRRLHDAALVCQLSQKATCPKAQKVCLCKALSHAWYFAHPILWQGMLGSS